MIFVLRVTHPTTKKRTQIVHHDMSEPMVRLTACLQNSQHLSMQWIMWKSNMIPRITSRHDVKWNSYISWVICWWGSLHLFMRVMNADDSSYLLSEIVFQMLHPWFLKSKMCAVQSIGPFMPDVLRCMTNIKKLSALMGIMPRRAWAIYALKKIVQISWQFYVFSELQSCSFNYINDIWVQKI